MIRWLQIISWSAVISWRHHRGRFFIFRDAPLYVVAFFADAPRRKVVHAITTAARTELRSRINAVKSSDKVFDIVAKLNP